MGVAGSNGKTTVKEMIASILSQRGECLATRGNLNNQIGVPLTLLRLSDAHRNAVIEIGANRAGEVAELADIAKPDVGLITNAGAEHLEGFGDLAGVARAEGEMVAGLEATGAAVLNVDDEYFPLWNGMTRARRVTFGIREVADYRASGIANHWEKKASRCLSDCMRCGRARCGAQCRRSHNVYNALCAAAAAQQAGATLDEVVQGLRHAARRGRLRPGRTRQGARLIEIPTTPIFLDAWHRCVAHLPGRAWFVMGDMGELGDFAQASHVEIGRYARDAVSSGCSQRSVEHAGGRNFGAGATWYRTPIPWRARSTRRSRPM